MPSSFRVSKSLPRHGCFTLPRIGTLSSFLSLPSTTHVPLCCPFPLVQTLLGRSSLRKRVERAEEPCAWTLSLCPGPGNENGRGPTALVRPGRDNRRSSRTRSERGAKGAKRLGPSLTLCQRQGQSFGRRWNSRGAFGNKVNHAVAGFGLSPRQACVSGSLGPLEGLGQGAERLRSPHKGWLHLCKTVAARPEDVDEGKVSFVID